MDAKQIFVGTLLSGRQRFIVPIYQRTYAWTAKALLPALFEQVKEKAFEQLQGRPVRFAHYMGALLVIPQGDPVFGRIQAFSVVDGQQRLTTFCLLVAALKDVAREKALTDLEKQLGDLLVHSDDVPMDDRSNERYRLQPTAYDKAMFRDLVDLPSSRIRAKYGGYYYKNGSLRDATSSLPLAAYEYFRGAIGQALAEAEELAPGSVERQLRAIASAIFECFKMIVITLAKDDDAQVIFETLNSGGKPLAAMDLVRNDVFYRAALRNEDVEALLEQNWKVFEDAFWKQDQTQGRITKPRIDFYLAHLLAAERGRAISLSDLYSEYKSFVTDVPLPTSSDELERLTTYTDVYRALSSGDASSALGRLAKCLLVFEVTTAYPLVFVVAASSIDDAEKEKVFRYITSYIVRREICRSWNKSYSSKNYNNVFAEMAGRLRRDGASVASFVSALRAKADAPTASFPSDEAFEEAIRRGRAYGGITQSRLRYILESLEFTWRSKFSIEGSLKSDLTIEHIMPQAWQENWPIPNKADEAVPADDKEAAQKRNDTVNTLPNLTLLTPPANSSAGNGSFKSKKHRLVDSLLAMNAEIAGLPDDAWTEAVGIAQRANAIVQRAKALWPGLE